MNLLEITSPANPRFKDAIQLRDAQKRRRSGRFLVDGRREISRALAADLRARTIFFEIGTPPASVFPPQQLRDTELIALSTPLLSRLAYGERNEGCVAIFETPARQLASIQLPPNPLVVVLDQLEKPGNIGAVLRSADAAGVDAVILVDCYPDLFNPNTIRASCGTVFSIPLAATNFDTARVWLEQHEIQVFALRVGGSRSLWDCDFRGPTALLVGSESAGLGDRWSAREVQSTMIPMQGKADSLNASVASAICFFEAVRQRHCDSTSST